MQPNAWVWGRGSWPWKPQRKCLLEGGQLGDPARWSCREAAWPSHSELPIHRHLLPWAGDFHSELPSIDICLPWAGDFYSELPIHRHLPEQVSLLPLEVPKQSPGTHFRRTFWRILGWEVIVSDFVGLFHSCCHNWVWQHVFEIRYNRWSLPAEVKLYHRALPSPCVTNQGVVKECLEWAWPSLVLNISIFMWFAF